MSGHKPGRIMADPAVSINVLGVVVPFKPGADLERARQAARLIEERFAEQQARGSQSKENLLVFLALGLADELLQMKLNQEEVEARISSLFVKIEKSL